MLESAFRANNPAVFGVRGRGDPGVRGLLLSGKGSDEELRRGSTACRSRCVGRGLSIGCRRTELDDAALFKDLALPVFDEVANPPGGALSILPDSLIRDLAEAVAVVLLLPSLCCD